MSHLKFTLDVLIPHFRDPDGLKASLESVAGQTWRGGLRVIVVDDGSPEAEFREAASHCEAFRMESGFDLVLLRNEDNLGRPRTRNRLLDAVEASHVAWLDAGDIWYPEKLRRQFNHLARLLYDGQDIDRVWVTCDYDWAQNGSIRMVTQQTEGDQLQSLLIGAQLRAYLWTLLGTARAFRIAGHFDERLTRLQDLDYFVNFVRGGGRIVVAEQEGPLCCYFKSQFGRSAVEVKACYKLILAKNAPALKLRPPSLLSEVHYKANRLASRFAKANRQYGTAALYLAQAVFGSPRHSTKVLQNVASQRLRPRSR
jgi:glycosyltransferase involved in cell wall biosynthesis